jgi:SAM-dependent methyltransferase
MSILRSGHPPPAKRAASVTTSAGTQFAAPPTRPSRGRQDRLARLYDDEVYPLFGQRFAEMLLAAADIRPHTAILEVGCAAGAITAEIAHRLDAESRIVALDGSTALLELARARVRDREHVGRRVFFRHHATGTKLPFAEETYDVVLANAALGELPDPAATVADLARVCKPGGQVVLATPLRGTWLEFVDIFREVLIHAHRDEALTALEAYVNTLPEAETVARHLESAGLAAPEIEVVHWELVFRSAREFFYAPVIEHGPLARWKEIAGRETMQETFLAIKESIDTYFAGRAFSVSVFGGRFASRKPAA